MALILRVRVHALPKLERLGQLLVLQQLARELRQVLLDLLRRRVEELAPAI